MKEWSLQLPEDFKRKNEIAEEYMKDNNIIASYDRIFHDIDVRNDISEKYNISKADALDVVFIMHSELEYINRKNLETKVRNNIFDDEPLVFKTSKVIEDLYNYIINRDPINRDMIMMHLKGYHCYNNFTNIVFDIQALLNIYISEFMNIVDEHTFDNSAPMMLSLTCTKMSYRLQDYVDKLKNEDAFTDMTIVEESYQNELKWINKRYHKGE